MVSYDFLKLDYALRNFLRTSKQEFFLEVVFRILRLYLLNIRPPSQDHPRQIRFSQQMKT